MNRQWAGKRVLILGAARQGLALTRYLLAQGAVVTLNDKRSSEQLKASMESLKHEQLTWVTGEHPMELLDTAEMVCLSGGVPLDLPIVREAAARGLPLSNDSQIFAEACPAPITAITGSAGKTTTTTLVGRMAQHGLAAGQRAWVGGNIGQPLVEFIDQINPGDRVVLELSSFQLEQMTAPMAVSAVLNITPNHLDRHGTLEAYAAAKARILDFQHAGSRAVLNREDPGSWNLRERVKGNLLSFGLLHPARGEDGVFTAAGMVRLVEKGKESTLLPLNLIRLRGEHNTMNVLAACAVAHASGYPVEAMLAGVSGFTGVAHRLELVRILRGTAWYNDSIATAPERTAAAIRSFNEPLVLLLGGRDKNLPWDDLAALVRQRVDHVVLFGEAADKIAAAIGKPGFGRPYSLARCAGLQEAVLAAAAVVEAGDVVLLSPGGTSYDQFRDFEERGESYRLWVNQLS